MEPRYIHETRYVRRTKDACNGEPGSPCRGLEIEVNMTKSKVTIEQTLDKIIDDKDIFRTQY